MYEKLSTQVKKILMEAQKIASDFNFNVVGTESVILSMYNFKDSICTFLFNEYSLDIKDYEELLKKVELIRGNNNSILVFTKRLKQIIDYSIKLSKKYNSDLVYDEHLFYAIIDTKNVASNLLERLGLDLDAFKADIIDIYNWDKKVDIEEKKYLRNITLEAKKDKLPPFVGREKYIEKIKRIMMRKTKNNPLLIGSAGVGKTAIVEGLTKHFLKNKDNKKYEIVSLNLGLALAGTKYRGDFEKKLLGVVETIEKNENLILFIDEIHNLVGAGSSDGSMDAANILKPILTMSDVLIIGATTLEEYNKFIAKDKALSRRFQTLFIEEPSVDEMHEILVGIKKDYQNFHKVDIKDDVIEYLIYETNNKIKNRKFPDKGIDVLDESFIEAKLLDQKEVMYKDVEKAISNITGIDIDLDVTKKELKYQFLKKYLMKFYFNIQNKNIINLYYSGKNSLKLIKEIKSVFNLKDEMVLNLDLSDFSEDFSISSLIGAPPGYIGHDDEGVLIDHVNKFPMALLVFNNITKTSNRVQTLLKDILKNYKYVDRKGRTIYFENTIIMFCEETQISEKIAGFNKNNNKNKVPSVIEEYIDEIVIEEKEKELDLELINRYLFKLKVLGYDIDIDNQIVFDVNLLKEFETFVLNLVNTKENGKYCVKYNEKNCFFYV